VSVATPPSPRSEEQAPAGEWGPDRLAPENIPGRPIAESCPLCGAALGAEQDWCLRCGAAARTRLAATPSWRAPVIALAAVIVLSLGALTAALVSLAGDSEGSTSTVAVTRTVTTPAVAGPAVTTPAVTTPTTAIGTASTPGSIVPGAGTTAPGAGTTAPSATTTAPSATAPRAGTTAAGKATAPTTTAPPGTSTRTGTAGSRGATTGSATGSAPAAGSGAAKSTQAKATLERYARAYQRHLDKATGTPAG
jgi:hypothetical protein